MLEYIQSMLQEPWKPISRSGVIAWLVFYALFLAYAFSAHGGFLFIDSANLVVHEGGHNLFGWFGPTLGLYGGTLLQWLVPFLLAIYFFTQRQIFIERLNRLHFGGFNVRSRNVPTENIAAFIQQWVETAQEPAVLAIFAQNPRFNFKRLRPFEFDI